MRGGIVGGGFLILAGIAAFLIHQDLTGLTPAWPVGAAVAMQAAAAVWFISRKLAFRYRGIPAVVVILILAAVFLFGLPVRSVDLAFGGMCHAAAYVGLLAWFAGSLRPGQEPAVTGFARRIRRTMPDKVLRYTRWVTIAWCAFFGGQIGISALLLTMASQTVWISFVNLWNLPLVLSMIVAEFGVRLLLFRREPRTGLLDTLYGLHRLRARPGSLP
jgi:uncharacterized membrane protein